MTIKMEMERATKNTIRFAEILEDALSAPAICTFLSPHLKKLDGQKDTKSH